MNNLIQQKGITLIALEVTIIVLLILAGVSISSIVGENGVLSKARTAKENTEKATALEEVTLAWTSVETDYWNGLNNVKRKDVFTKKNLNKYLSSTGEVIALEYVENGTSKVKYKRHENEKEYKIEINSNGNMKVVEEFSTTLEELKELAQEAAIGDLVAYTSASSYAGSWIVSNIDTDGYVYLISSEVVSESSFSDLNLVCAQYVNDDFANSGSAPKKEDISNVNNMLTSIFWINETYMNEYCTSNYYTFETYGIIRNSDGTYSSIMVHRELTGGAWGESSYDTPCGVCPIIKLKSGIMTPGKNDSGEWILRKS